MSHEGDIPYRMSKNCKLGRADLPIVPSISSIE